MSLTATPRSATAFLSATPAMVRQPIVDGSGQSAAYELQGQHTDVAGYSACGAADMKRVLAELPLSKLAGGLPLWLPINPLDVLAQACSCPPDVAVVLRLTASMIGADPAVVAALHALGYRLALGDAPSGLDPAIRQHVMQQLAYVVLDGGDGDPSQWQQAAMLAAPSGLVIVASRVPTWQLQQQLQAVGAVLFHGAFLTSPDWTQLADHSDNRISVVRLLNELRSAQASVAELEAVIRADPVMTFNLLKMINAAAFGLRQEVHTVRHALLYMGLDRVANWARMLALGSMANRSVEVMKIALIRGRLLELQSSRHYSPEIAFEAGLFSMLDALMRTPMASLLDDVAVAPQVREAILFNDGELGYLLRCLVQYERGHWNANDDAMNASIWRHYPDAVAWADHACQLAVHG